jgi:uncharacterized protein YjiS (DUF1127 family)
MKAKYGDPGAEARNGVPPARQRVARPALALIEVARHSRRRDRNLAELRALDGVRLDDIGLTRQARARILGGDLADEPLH